eukprot:NODE_1384_length_1526_cov_33.583274_g942_i1.p2 GENE.NODE_1384_length_1526_cov_33.583274_g942_i1~~NODE_1384_length_1526_cov_33.583274_g942_i1.p2  ORF type:complete len:236 (-),score=53.65 NODE_1384_length_1526_cov_33.583274_g942_i1:110-817(-)
MMPSATRPRIWTTPGYTITSVCAWTPPFTSPLRSPPSHRDPHKGLEVVVNWNNPAHLQYGSVVDDQSVAAIPLYTYSTTHRQQLHLSDCMKYFTSKEQLGETDMVYCASCKEHKRSYKEFGLWRLPQYLVIQLKRFQYTLSRWGGSKLDHLVTFPLDDWDVHQFIVPSSPAAKEPAVYELCGVTNHSGSLHFGHYTAHCLQAGQWHSFNDGFVGQASPSAIVDPEAYVLFYKRKA